MGSATPGPSLLHLAPQTPLSAFNSVAWSVLLLLFIPAALYRALIGPLKGAGLRVGDWRFGLAAVVPLALAAALLIGFSTP